jgi:hypothetical protein
MCLDLVTHSSGPSVPGCTVLGDVAFIMEVEARAALAEREAWERVLRMEAKSVVALASAHGEVEGFDWRIALSEGELT